MNYLKSLIILTTLLLSLSSFGEELKGTVIGVKDGDTIELLTDKAPITIRLYGIDTPEKSQPFATKAKEYLSEQIYKKEVKVEAFGKDRYQRTLGVITLEGRNINEELINNGLAHVFTRYCTKSFCKDWHKTEAENKKNKVGLWAHKDVMNPADFRKEEKKLKQQKKDKSK